MLADGKPVILDITVAEMEFEGEIVGGTVVYGENDAEPLLGVTALESGGFEVDPRSQALKRLPAVLLKTSKTRSANPPTCASLLSTERPPSQELHCG